MVQQLPHTTPQNRVALYKIETTHIDRQKYNYKIQLDKDGRAKLHMLNDESLQLTT